VVFQQVVPVLVTRSLLERMRNNFMVIEVWDKKTTAQNDQVLSDSFARACFLNPYSGLMLIEKN